MAVAANQTATGFADPVFDAQAVFRAAMLALARPGTVQPVTARCAPPQPLGATAAALALALCDYETALWLDPPLAASAEIAAYLRFHTGAALTGDPAQAALALLAAPDRGPPLSAFAQGSLDYPDRSTTLILQVEHVGEDDGVRLSGPGIATAQRFAAAPLGPRFWADAQHNRNRFPCGVDMLFAAPGRLAGLPRSTRIAVQEA